MPGDFIPAGPYVPEGGGGGGGELALKAPIASPTFTGTPAAPTATQGTNTTQVATTAFVQAASGPSGYSQSFLLGGM